VVQVLTADEVEKPCR